MARKPAYSKRGLAPIVGVVLLILLAVAGVIVLGGFVLELAKQPSLSPAFSCLDAQTSNAFTLQSACYNSSSQSIRVIVQRSESALPANMIFTILSLTGESTSYRCGEGCGMCMLQLPGETKTYYFNYQGSKPDSVEVVGAGCSLGQVTIGSC